VGLAVVQRLVELHQGEVTIESQGVGLGTEVRITLPCISEVPQSTDTHAAAPPPRQEGKRILVIDDNSDAAESIAVLLRLDGHEVKTVTDGMQALACVDVFAPHVAVVDIGLPGMSGYEVARHIRDNGSPAPLLIALTGYGQAEDLDRSREAGFDHHFVKPADFKEIKQVIETASAHDARAGLRSSR
jgi:CheY-like chemotaxis protein